jgi:hypothetical protein
MFSKVDEKSTEDAKRKGREMGSSCMPPFAARGIAPPAETSEVGRPTRLPFSSSLLSSSSFFFFLCSILPIVDLAGTQALPRRNPKSSTLLEP